MVEYSPKISIIIPVYNVENCLRVGLDSILRQTYTNFEVILVNDGSTDNSYTICTEYVEKDSRFSLFNQKNAGVAEARNRGINVSGGEYITFMDSDDWVEDDWLETYVNALQQVRPDILVQGIAVDTDSTNYRVFVEDNFYENMALFDAFHNLEKHGLEGFVPIKMYRASLVKKHNLKFRYMLHEDTLFNTELFCYATSLITLSKVCYHYVQRRTGSLVTRRYPFDYMMSLIISLRDARLQMSEAYNRADCRDEIWTKYIGMHTILLFSLYDKNRGVADRKRRLSILKDYQAERRSSKLPLNFSTFGKSFFSKMVMLPPALVDFLLKTLFLLK